MQFCIKNVLPNDHGTWQPHIQCSFGRTSDFGFSINFDSRYCSARDVVGDSRRGTFVWQFQHHAG